MKVLKKFLEQILHSDLGGVQGGQDGEYYHLTAAEYRRSPVAPSVESPLDGERNVGKAPQIVGTHYFHPYDVSMYGKHIQIATDNDFENIVYEKVEVSGSVAFQVPLKPDGETSYLTEGTEHHVRIQYQDRRGQWSGWGPVSTFTTAAVFPPTILVTPIMTAPADGGYASTIDPILGMSPGKVLSGLATFTAADWQISTDPDFDTTLYNVEGSPDTVFHVADVDLGTAVGVDFYARGRQCTGEDKTEWAHPVRFGLRPEYEDPVFGMRRIFSKRYGLPIVYNIDPEGEPVFIPRKYFDAHPLYHFEPRPVVLGQDGNGVDVVSEMVWVLPCYMKYSVYDNEDGDLTIDMWFATAPQGDGWALHPAFTRSTSGFLHGSSLCYQGSIIVGGSNVWVPVSKAEVYGVAGLHKYIANLPGDGWHCWTIWERMLLLDLLMAERCTFFREDIATSFGEKNAAPNMYWRGLWCMLFNDSIAIYGAGFQYASDKASFEHVRIMTPLMNGSFIEIPMTLITGNNIEVTDIYRGYADELGVDVALLGIPKEAVASSGNVRKKTAYGMEGVQASTNYVESSVDMIQHYSLTGRGPDLFGLLSGGYIPGNMRVSKWMD